MSLRSIKIIIFTAMCGLIVAALFTSVLVVERQDALRQLSRYNAMWIASQAANEYMRLEEVIARTLVPGGQVNADEVQLRLDIVASRLSTLQNGEFGEFIHQSPDRQALIGRLTSIVQTVQPMVERIGAGDGAAQALRLLSSLDAPLLELAAAANRYGGDRVIADQRELIALHWRFSSITGVMFVLGVALFALLLVNHRMLGKAHGELRSLAADLRATSTELERANADISNINAELQARNDILSRRDRELGVQNRRFDAALNNMSHALCMVDAADRLVVFNARFADLFEIEITPLPGMPFVDLTSSAIRPLRDIVSRQKGLPYDEQPVGFIYDKSDRAISVSHQAMPEGGWVATYEDVSSRRRVEAQIAHMAHHDGLTNLVNRTHFHARLDEALKDLRNGGPGLAIFSIDLDGFKGVNDTMGHPLGDELLRQVGLRLKEHMRDEDVVARVGGDEFAVLQVGADVFERASELAARMVAILSEPFNLEGTVVAVGASVGIAFAPDHGVLLGDLMKNADLALYRAKADGRKTYRMFEIDMDNELKARRALEADLRQALTADEFEVHYQPLVNARSMQITGFEALIRWHHPTRGMVPPADFIPVAEETGLIVPIGEWVLRQACAQATTWPGGLTLAVNLSPAQFKGRSIVEAVMQALVQSGLPAKRLELEITESLLLHDNEATLGLLHEFKMLGIQIAMDDFGTGYSSLSYLRSFPFDKIKIDQSFVREMSTRSDCVKIVRSISALGASLGMETTAEGVETVEQLQQLQAAGCDQVQGYLLGRPKPAPALQFTLSSTMNGMRAA